MKHAQEERKVWVAQSLLVVLLNAFSFHFELAIIGKLVAPLIMHDPRSYVSVRHLGTGRLIRPSRMLLEAFQLLTPLFGMPLAGVLRPLDLDLVHAVSYEYRLGWTHQFG